MPSEADENLSTLRDRLIGLGERSIAKSYYPELKRRLEDLERFRAVMHHADDAIFIFETAGWTVTDVNETALNLLGLTQDKVISAHISQFLPLEITARYAGAAPEDGDLDQDSRGNGHLMTVLAGRDGRHTPVEINVARRSFAGAGYAVVIARDVTMRRQMEAELDNSRQLFTSFMENSPVVAFIKDMSGQYIFINPAYCALLDAKPEDILGHSDLDLWPQDVADMLRENDRYVLSEGRPLVIVEAVRLRTGGAPRLYQVTKFPLFQNGVSFALAGIAVDITAQIRTEQALQRSEDRYRIVADYTNAMECWISPTGEMLYVSPSCERITGYQLDHFLSDPSGLEHLVHPEDLEAWQGFHARVLQSEDDSLDFRIRHKNGDLRWVSETKREVMGGNGGSMGSRISLRDITSRKEMELQLRHLALHDPLTGLANRTLCLDRLRQVMTRAQGPQPYHFALVFLDLDRFKVLNDSLGHAFGDKVLMAVSDVLRGCVQGQDTVSRFGGDEFVILLEEVRTPRESIQAVQRIRQALALPLLVDGLDIQLTASLGITLGAQQAVTPEDLLRNADVAMHQAKKAGRNRFKVFTRAMLARASMLLSMETDLRRAIARQEFFVVYQPIVRLDGKATLQGFEALVRWSHPENGLISPNEFIPVAEDTGLIVELGIMVLREACRDLIAWRETSKLARTLVMSVNLSPRQFSEPLLVETIRAVLEETGLPPEALKLEITETAIMENAGSAVEKLKKLKALGITLSVDDFGTGYSSMSSLQQFPLDTLKIDLSFIRRLDTSQEGLEIVKAIISLAHSLKLQVVAEGVERAEQQMVLTVLQCEYAQGYLYAKPLPEAQARQYLLGCVDGCK
ncbi:MAG: EAL domain-containing protein [Proteobacteria bacterium]|nr:EAL domain-containing protein [Pseudomonadota bacterium]MBU1594421.1 EAL domain-containing protein [Pseudomonadota bacterium]